MSQLASDLRPQGRRFQVGDSVSLTRRITPALVRRFAQLTGDTNPLHLDPEYASQTRFKRPIAHGMLAATQIATLIGTRLPGPGAIYLSQDFTFLAPVYLGDEITATVGVKSVRISEHRRGEPILTLETICTARDGVKVIDGEAIILYEPV